MYRRILLVLCSAFLASRASAAPTIGASAANPTSVAAGVATTVTFTSAIASPAVIASSVNLQQINTLGQATVIGTMYDDGTHGDAAANDGIYTLQFPIFQQTPGALTFRVAAGFQGSLTRGLSAPILLNVTGTGTAITINSPAEAAYLSISPTVVTGTVSDPGATVLVNGLPAQVSGTNFSASIPLREGSNKITAAAANTNGINGTATETITLDTTPPHVTISAPVASATTDSATVNVSGIVNDIVVGTVNALQATVNVNGVEAQVSNRTYLAPSVPLQLGPNTITATARDRAGNFTTTTVTVTRVGASTQAALRVVSGDAGSGPIKTVLGRPLVVQALNAAGQPIPGTPVVFQVVKGDGSVSPNSQPGLSATAVNTDGQGLAQVNFILGSHAGAGNNQVQASATGIAVTPVFTESATTTAASLIVVDSGGNQSGVVGQALPLPFIAVVTDSGHNRLPNVPVSFTVVQGGGTLGGQSTITTTSDSDGRVEAILTLGPQSGISNNVVSVTFNGNAGLPASFTATSYVPGPAANTAISGTVLDNSNQPIPGVTMRLYQVNNGGTGIPQEVVGAVQTNGAGYFMIQPSPVGLYKLMADGRTATAGGPFPTLEYDVVTVSGQNITVGQPIYLQQLHPQNELCVSPTVGGTLTIPEAPGFALKVAANTAVFPGGSRTGCISVTPVNMDKVPMVPGFGQQPRFIVTIQPVGTMFTTPAQLTIPNVDGLAPRAVTEMYSYDHDLASFVAIGTGTVSADGSVISSDPGVGVLKAGWHCGGDPNSSGTAADLSLTISPAKAIAVLNKTVQVTANGGPPLDGTYLWTVPSELTPSTGPSCPNAASCQATFTGAVVGSDTMHVCFKCSTPPQNQICKDVPTIVFTVTQTLKNTGTIPPSPENDSYDEDKSAAGGTDQLGPLPMGQGRGDIPGNIAYTSPLVMIGKVSPDAAADGSITFRWTRLITRRSWNIELSSDGTQWLVTQRSSRIASDDTGSPVFQDATPSTLLKSIYFYDDSALLPGNDPNDAGEKIGDYIREEKAFTYSVEYQNGSTWQTVSQTSVGQIEIVKRKALTGVVSDDWNGIENSTAIRTVDALITEAEVRAMVGGTLPIKIDANANN